MKSIILLRQLVILVVFLLRVEVCFSYEKRAFVTVVTTENDVEPAMAMGSSLRAMTRSSDSVHNASYSIDYICLVLKTEDFPGDEKVKDEVEGVSMLGIKKLGFAGWTTRPVSNSISNKNSNRKYWEEKDYNRIWLWSLSEYDKIVYVSTDILIIQDLKELFESDVHFGAAPQMFASHEFDSSIMVIQPDMSIFVDMMSRTLKTGVDSSWDFDEFVNDFFSEWNAMSQKHRLSPFYNAPYFWTQNENWIKYRSSIKAVHFKDEKPWLILQDPTQFQVSKYGAPLIYVWAILLFFISNPLGHGLEDETRYVLTKIFDVRESSESLAKYIEKMKRGGTRLRVGIHDNEEL